MRRRGLTGSFWPSRRQEALLRLALAPDVDVDRAWRELQPLEIETLEEGSFALLPLVHDRLVAAGVEDARLPRLAGTYRSTWVRNQLQLERLAQLLEALAAAGSPPLVVGGAAVAARYYAQLGLRPIVQLELIVAPEEAARAGSVLSRNGWRIASRRPGRTSRLVNATAPVTAVLHEGAPAYFSGPSGSAETLSALREAASEQALGGAVASTLAPADELLLTCATWARRTLAPGIQWLVDAHSILASGEVALDRLAVRAHAQRLVLPVHDTLAYLVATTQPPAAEAALAQLDERRATVRERLAHRLAANGLGPLGSAPESVLEYTRATLDQPGATAVRGLPRALREAWGLERGERVPLAAARKALARVRRAGGAKGSAGAQVPASGGRSRSASS